MLLVRVGVALVLLGAAVARLLLWPGLWIRAGLAELPGAAIARWLLGVTALPRLPVRSRLPAVAARLLRRVRHAEGPLHHIAAPVTSGRGSARC